MLIFRIKKQLPKLKIRSICLPTDKEALEKLGNEISTELDTGVGPKMDVLYTAIYRASKKLNLIKTRKGFGKLKFYWSQQDYTE